jgi:hypothetical protein
MQASVIRQTWARIFRTYVSVKMRPEVIATILILGVLTFAPGSALAQNCSSFSNCAEAVKSFKAGNTKLDRDKDGIPCEKICGSNGENMPR